MRDWYDDIRADVGSRSTQWDVSMNNRMLMTISNIYLISLNVFVTKSRETATKSYINQVEVYSRRVSSIVPIFIHTHVMHAVLIMIDALSKYFREHLIRPNVKYLGSSYKSHLLGCSLLQEVFILSIYFENVYSVIKSKKRKSNEVLKKLSALNGLR